MYQVLIVDDDQNYRYAIREVMEEKEPEFVVEDEAVNGRQALRKLQERHFDLVITDMSMPIMNGVELIREAKRQSPKVLFLALSDYDDFAFVKESLVEGAVDYVLKMDMEEEGFQKAIARVKILLDERKEAAEIASIQENSAIQNSEIRRALLYMRDYYKENLTLQEMADYVGLNKNYFSNLFKEEMGETFVKYLNRLRITKAIEYLKQGVYKNYELAELVGYHNASYFSKIFKEMEGMTIEEYKKEKHL